MLCQPCIRSIESLSVKRSFLEYTFYHELLEAVRSGCYICTQIRDRLQDEGTLNRLTNEEYLLSRVCVHELNSKSGGTFMVYVYVNYPFDYLGRKRFAFRLVPLSSQDDQYGFRLLQDETHDLRAVHSTYKMIPLSTGSPEVGRLARQWYRECKAQHPECSGRSRNDRIPDTSEFREKEAVVEYSTWFPPRLLDVSSDAICLVLREHAVTGEAFAALSHCWGKHAFLQLTRENLESFQEKGIDLVAMPKNFSNVAQICRWLGIRYLWIDSLCILQSGPGSQSDWELHVRVMRLVYARCDVCISTAATDSAMEPCFRERNATAIAPQCVLINEEPHLLIARDHALHGHRNSPLASRAWVLQERLLARRILTFGPEQIFWECIETVNLNVCEAFPQGLVRYGLERGPFALPVAEDHAGSWPPSSEHVRLWNKLIATYSDCQLTRKHEDKFVAFAGVAQAMQAFSDAQARKARVPTEHVAYVAGFFAFQLPMGLLWSVDSEAKIQSRLKTPSGFYRAPSWSWAATDSLIIMHHTQKAPFVPLTTLQSHRVTLAQEDNPYGQLVHAELTLRGPVLPITWSGTLPSSWVCPEGTFVLPTIDHKGFLHGTRFDTRDDFETSQDGVMFMPFVVEDRGYKGGGRVHGLLLRPVDHEKRSYMRIGKAVLYEQDISKYKALVKHEITVL